MLKKNDDKEALAMEAWVGKPWGFVSCGLLGYGGELKGVGGQLKGWFRIFLVLEGVNSLKTCKIYFFGANY